MIRAGGYVPRHRADLPVDSCSAVNEPPGPIDCLACARYVGRHFADVRAVSA